MYLTSPADDHFIQALKEHIKSSLLWLQWDRWQEEVADYATASRSLFSWVKDRTEAELFQKIEPGDLEPIQEWVFGNILCETSGGKSEELKINGVEFVMPNGWTLARARSANNAQTVKENLVGMQEEAKQLPEWTQVQRAAPKLAERQLELRQIAIEIGSALDGIKLMRAFPGRCHLCPV
jgi:hypothetical protein